MVKGGAILEQAEKPEVAAVSTGELVRDALPAQEWVERLSHAEAQVRAEAAEALGRLGNPATCGPLSRALGDRDSWVRAQAAQALGRLGDVRMVPLLIRALDDRDPWVRARAAEALALLGDVRAVEPLLAAAAHPETGHSWVAEALGRLGDRRAVEPLVGLLRSTDRMMRFRAALALGRLGDARAVFPLTQMLSDADGHVAEAAAEALTHLAAREPGPELRVALPRLRALSAATSGYAVEVRELFRRALIGIEAATDRGALLRVPGLETQTRLSASEVSVVRPEGIASPPPSPAPPSPAVPSPTVASPTSLAQIAPGAPSVLLWLERMRNRMGIGDRG